MCVRGGRNVAVKLVALTWLPCLDPLLCHTAPAPTGGAAALFAEINAKGAGGVTSGLKKVSKDQMTHKNPALRASSVVPDKAGAAAAAKAAPVAKVAAKKPVRVT